jgi:predicted dehydrogenase
VFPDREDRAAFEKTFGIEAADTLESVLETVEPEIVSICSPSALHFETGCLLP